MEIGQRGQQGATLMIKKLIITILLLLFPTTVFGAWKFNPHTGKLDYYEASGGGSGNVTSDAFALDQVAFGLNATSLDGNANLTWNNTLQQFTINGNTTIQKAGDLYHIIEAYTTGTGDPVTIYRVSHNDTIGTLTTTPNTKELAKIWFQGVNASNNAFAYGAFMRVVQDGVAANFVPTKIVLQTYSNTSANTNQLVLGADGSVKVRDFDVVTNDTINTSAELLGIMGDETGTGLVVFNTSPNILTPTISGALTITEGALTDSMIVSADIKDYTINGSTDIENTSLTDLKKKEFNFGFTVEEPDLLTNATGLPVRSTIIWTNLDSRTYTITYVSSITDADNYNITLWKSFNFTNTTAAACTGLNNITIADNGESCFYNNTSSLDNATIEAGKRLIFQGTEDVNATKVHIFIKGNFS